MGGIRILLVSALAITACGNAAAEQPLCIYHNRTYSDGARICVQRQLMLTCNAEGGRAVWRIVEEDRLARLCATPVAAAHTAQATRPAARSPGKRRTAATPKMQAPSEKCFTFQGRHYCE
jgi:hypothetical protein